MILNATLQTTQVASVLLVALSDLASWEKLGIVGFLILAVAYQNRILKRFEVAREDRMIKLEEHIKVCEEDRVVIRNEMMGIREQLAEQRGRMLAQEEVTAKGAEQRGRMLAQEELNAKAAERILAQEERNMQVERARRSSAEGKSRTQAEQ